MVRGQETGLLWLNELSEIGHFFSLSELFLGELVNLQNGRHYVIYLLPTEKEGAVREESTEKAFMC